MKDGHAIDTSMSLTPAGGTLMGTRSGDLDPGILVFTGGIGEQAAPVRAEACRGLESFGLELDATLNARNAAIISSASSRSLVRVVTTDEDLVIARHARQLVSTQPPAGGGL